MSKRPRRNHSAGFKAKVALAAVKGDRHGLCAHGDRGKLLGVICRASPCVRPPKGVPRPVACVASCRMI